MNGDSEKNVNVKASLNGKELSADSVVGVLDALFRGGWLDDVLKSALSASSAATERVRVDLDRHMQTLRQTLQQAARAAEPAPSGTGGAAAAESSEEPKQGEAS